MAGAPRKPQALKELQGTDQPCRRNPNEPQYPVDAPAKPDQVAANPEASAEWDRIVPFLVEARTIGHVSRSGLTSYCLAWARVLRVEDDPESSLKEEIDAATSLRQADSALGITPTTVGKVAAAPAAEAKSALGQLQDASRGLRAVK